MSIPYPYAILACLIGYLAGSLSTARLVMSLFSKDSELKPHTVTINGSEMEATVSGFGGTSVAAILGPRFGLLVVALDMLKVAVPVLIIRMLFAEELLTLLVALSGVAGHNWPIYYRFRGGRGFSATLGGLLVIDPLALIINLLSGMLIGIVLLRSVTIAYIGWLPLLILWFWVRTDDLTYVWFAVALNIFFVLASLPEFVEMIQYRREGKFDSYMSALESSSTQRRVIQKMIDRFNLISIVRKFFQRN